MYVWVVKQPVSNSSPHSCMCNEQWIFYNNYAVIGQIRKSFNGQNCFEDVAIKYRKTEVNSLHYACKNAEMNPKSTT